MDFQAGIPADPPHDIQRPNSTDPASSVIEHFSSGGDRIPSFPINLLDTMFV